MPLLGGLALNIWLSGLMVAVASGGLRRHRVPSCELSSAPQTELVRRRASGLSPGARRVICSRFEAVADPGLGDEVPRVRRIGLQLAA